MEPQMRFDFTISIGHIIIALSAVVSAVAAYYAITSQIAIQQERISVSEATNTAQNTKIDTMVDALNSIRTDIAIIRYRVDQNARR